MLMKEYSEGFQFFQTQRGVSVNLLSYAWRRISMQARKVMEWQDSKDPVGVPFV